MTATSIDRGAARSRHPSSRRPTPVRGGPPPGRPRRHGWTTNAVALALLVLALNLMGLVMVLSASSVVALDEYGSSWYVAGRQALWLAVGLVAAVAATGFDYHRLARWATPALVASGVLLAAVLVPGVGMEVNGASRWLGYGPFSLQPSELAKLAVLVWCAELLSRRAAWIDDVRLTLVPVSVVFGGVALLLMLQPNLGTTLVTGSIVLSLLYLAGTRLGPLSMLGLGGAALASALALSASYRRARILAFLDPWNDPHDIGYQTIQSLVGLASGGTTGTGLGESRSKWGFLPYAHTDFIYAIVGEELGLVGTVGLMAGFALVAVFGVRAALAAPDRFGMLLAGGITTWFVVQAFVNIGAVVAILPITGVPLPFVSYGGSSLVFSMVGAGILCNVARQGRSSTGRPAGGPTGGAAGAGPAGRPAGAR